jgi:hypothetical protein
MPTAGSPELSGAPRSSMTMAIVKITTRWLLASLSTLTGCSCTYPSTRHAEDAAKTPSQPSPCLRNDGECFSRFAGQPLGTLGVWVDSSSCAPKAQHSLARSDDQSTQGLTNVRPRKALQEPVANKFTTGSRSGGTPHPLPLECVPHIPGNGPSVREIRSLQQERLSQPTNVP